MISGILLVDKPQGPTSHDIVDQVRSGLGTRTVGHAGTLDPMATGLLVVLVGDGTRLSQFVMGEDKAYDVEVLLGVETDSGDLTGKVVRKTEDKVDVKKEDMEKAVSEMVGTLELRVPKYSAVKIQGRKLYEYARKGEDIEVPVKTMVIHGAQIKEAWADGLNVSIQCGKGTYIRSWVEELGRKLGVGATVKALRRTKSGEFGVENSIRLEELGREELMANLRPLGEALANWPSLRMIGRERDLVRNGQIPAGVQRQVEGAGPIPGLKLIDDQGALLAIGVSELGKKVRLAAVFNS